MQPMRLVQVARAELLEVVTEHMPHLLQPGARFADLLRAQPELERRAREQELEQEGESLRAELVELELAGRELAAYSLTVGT